MTTTTKKNLSKSERSAYALVGRIGGKAMAKKHGKSHMSAIGKLGAAARWHKPSTQKLKDEGSSHATTTRVTKTFFTAEHAPKAKKSTK